MSQSLTILFSCAGRRIELMQAFRAAARRLDVTLRVLAGDNQLTAPAMHCADEAFLMPRVSNPGYYPRLVEIIKHERVDVLLPTTDLDLLLISRHRDDLDALGCRALIARPEAIAICRDKFETSRFLQASGIDCPRTYSADQIRSLDKLPLPLFVKPVSGSASQRVHMIEEPLDLEYYLRKHTDLIIQEFIPGQEYTLDVYVGLQGEPRCVVPRARWQVRTGEVVKGVVVKDRRIMDAGRRVVEALGGDPRGLLTLQCIVTEQGRIAFIEINPRFGGGAPMGMAAGADYPGWLLQELLGQQPEIPFDGFQHGLCMLRYDWSVFLPLGEDPTPRREPPLGRWPAFL